jgi:hypothetical protein
MGTVSRIITCTLDAEFAPSVAYVPATVRAAAVVLAGTALVIGGKIVGVALVTVDA